MNNRKAAMIWWNKLSSADKTRQCDINTDLVGSQRRWESLTGREIEMLYIRYKKEDNYMFPTDIYPLDHLSWNED